MSSSLGRYNSSLELVLFCQHVWMPPSFWPGSTEIAQVENGMSLARAIVLMRALELMYRLEMEFSLFVEWILPYRGFERMEINCVSTVIF